VTQSAETANENSSVDHTHHRHGDRSHLRVADPFLSHVPFGVYLGVFAGGGLRFRDAT
jgi:hypothetical protein